MISRVLFPAFLILVLADAVHAADLKFASIFSDGVVVQRNQKIPVWGQGAPNSEVAISLGNQRGKAAVGADGWWRVDLPPMPAGGPFTMKASAAGKSVSVQDVLCGDVWLCAGQSNMQMGTSESVGGEKAASAAAHFPNVRLLSMGKGGANEPQREFGAKWEKATPEKAAKFSAVAYFFGSALLEDATLKNVPIGLIDCSFGGTAAEAWTPQNDVAWMQPGERSESMFGIPPSALFNGMVSPLAPAGLSGVVWYQGESNAGRPELYSRVLTSMIQGWRRQWDRPDLPFFVVQLPPFADKFGGHYFTWLREAQARVAKELPHTDLVATIDTTDGSDLHPREKQEIGRRAALLARRDVYREKIVARGPVFRSARIDGSRVRVAFETGGRGLASRNFGHLGGFQVAGGDGTNYFADAFIDGDEVVIESKHVAEPKTVRYAWSGVPRADLINRDGLPAEPFRTDTQPMADVEFQSVALHRLSTKSIELLVDDKGSVRSLGIGGQQFLSNSLGGSGGTTFLGKSLPIVEELQPDRLAFRNPSLALEITGDDEKTEWTITNSDHEEAKFQVMLIGDVQVTKQEDALLLERHFTRAKFEARGELRDATWDGRPWVITIPPSSTVVVKISHEK